jgi:uncharacterized protein YqgV (UPF0045/DUF77 family)
MDVTVEISIYPLTENYEQVVLNFIDQLHQNKNIQVVTNGLSTQMFGNYDEVMQHFLPEKIKQLFEQGKAVVLMKLAQGILKFNV